MSRQKERDRISKVLSALEGVFIETAFEANPEELLINHLIDNNIGTANRFEITDVFGSNGLRSWKEPQKIKAIQYRG